jgi:hypothetical protein
MKKQFLAALKGGALFGSLMGAVYLLVSIIPAFVGGFNIKLFISGTIMGVSVGVFGGLLFGLLMLLFSFVLTKKFEKIKNELPKDREIVFDEAANHFVGREGVGGWLFLFSDSLYFRSHAVNIQNHILEIPLDDIVAVERCRMRKWANNGILIKTAQGEEERFVVYSPDEWVEKINGMINQKASSAKCLKSL